MSELDVPAEWFAGSWDGDPTTEADGPGGDNDLDGPGVDRDWSDPDRTEYLRADDTPDNETGVSADVDIPGGDQPGDQSVDEGGMPDQPSVPTPQGVSTPMVLAVAVLGAVALAYGRGA